jgi:hypothetical protein
MRSYFPTFILLMFVVIGCDKSNPDPVEETNKNEILGYVTVAGRDTRLFVARADSTTFVRTTNNDTIVKISGFDGRKVIHLRLVNITSNGTYSFQNADTTLEDVTRAFYSEETLSYSTDGTNADILSFGTVEISEITATHIAAKLNVMLGDTGSLSKVYLEEIFIVGDFK